jgi:hypothetical protein
MGRKVLSVVDGVHPATALVGLQHALIETVVSNFPTNGVATALGCMQAVMVQVTKRMPGPEGTTV